MHLAGVGDVSGVSGETWPPYECTYTKGGSIQDLYLTTTRNTATVSAMRTGSTSSTTCGDWKARELKRGACSWTWYDNLLDIWQMNFSPNSTYCFIVTLTNDKQIQLETTTGGTDSDEHANAYVRLVNKPQQQSGIRINVTVPVTSTANPIPTHTLTIETPENGMIADQRGWLICGSKNYKCSEKFDEGLDVRLHATPANGYQFASWTGDCSGTENKYRFTIESDTTCSATFSKIPEPVRPSPVSQPTQSTGAKNPTTQATENSTNEEKTEVYSLGPANNGDYKSVVRTTNASTETINVIVTLYADNGAVLGNTTLTLPSQQSMDLTTDELKKMLGIGDWRSNAWLEFNSQPGALNVNFLLINPDGTVTDLTKTRKNAVYNIPHTANAYGDVLYLQFNNTSDQTINDITGTLYSRSGETIGLANALLVLEVAPKAMQTLTSDLIEQRVGISWQGRGWLQLDPEQPDIELLALFQSQHGVYHNMTPVSDDNILHGLPGSANPEQAFIRIVNTSDQTVQVTGTLYDSTGQILGQSDAILADSLPAHAIKGLKMRDLEKLAGIQPQKGKLKLVITSPTSRIAVAGYIRSQKGNVSNASAN